MSSILFQSPRNTRAQLFKLKDSPMDKSLFSGLISVMPIQIVLIIHWIALSTFWTIEASWFNPAIVVTFALKFRLAWENNPFFMKPLISPPIDIWEINKCRNSILMILHYPDLGSILVSCKFTYECDNEMSSVQGVHYRRGDQRILC